MTDIQGLFKRAEDAFQRRNYDYARDLLLNILVVDPDNEKVRESLYATCLRKVQETGGSGKIKTAVMQAKVQVEMAAAKSNVDKKIEIAQRYLCDEPNNSKIRTALAEMLKSKELWKAAAAEAKIAARADSRNLQAAKLLIETLLKLGQVQDAQQQLDKVVVFFPEDRDLQKLQRDLAAKQTMARGFEEAGTGGRESYRAVIKDVDKAEELERAMRLVVTEEDLARFVEALKGEMAKHPTDPKIPKKIGDAYFEKKKDYSEAREWYRRASHLAPYDSVLKDKVDDCTLRLLEVELEAAEKAGDTAKVSELKTNRLKFLIESFQRRVQERPTDMHAHYELGRAYYQAGHVDKAIAEFQQAVRDPKYKCDSHVFLGIAFHRKKLFDMADTQYQKAEEAGGGLLTQHKLLTIWYSRAQCNADAGKLHEAVELGKRIMEQDISFRDISQLVEKWTAAGAAPA